jgi:hypothetical protein
MQAFASALLGLALMLLLLIGGLSGALLFLLGLSWAVEGVARVFGGAGGPCSPGSS